MKHYVSPITYWLGGNMRDKKYKIGMVSTSNSVFESLERIDVDDTIELEYHCAKNLEMSVPWGVEMEKKGVEVIIGRRATASLLRKKLTIPILSLPVTSLDVLRCIKEATQYGKRIFLPSYMGLIEGIETIEELFGIEIIQQVYYDQDTLLDGLSQARTLNIDAVMGGGMMIRRAQKMGIPAVEIVISDDSISSILEDAKSVAQSKREELENAMHYRYIVDSASDGIISIDDTGYVTTINNVAKKLFGIQSESVEGDLLKNRAAKKKKMLGILKKGSPRVDELERIDNKYYLANYTPIEISSRITGMVTTFRNATHVMKAEKKLRRSYAKGLVAKYSLNDLTYISSVMHSLVTRVNQFAATDSTILISGETGTGKEIIAQSIHRLSPRKRGPFVSINCGALPKNLLESELFGYEEGAFTGSRRGGKPGLFELAHTGTIFLDEIASTPPTVQTRLLRVLQEKEVMRIGGDELFPVDVRVLAAANKPLLAEVRAGRFREDLLYRLDVLKIAIPPLHKRLEDLPILVESLLVRIAREHKKEPVKLMQHHIDALMDYHWPGNVRQLENFIQRLTLLCDDKVEDEDFKSLLEELTTDEEPSEEPPKRESGDTRTQEAKAVPRIPEEFAEIERVLQEAKYSKARAAEMLGISRSTLWRKIRTAQKAGFLL